MGAMSLLISVQRKSTDSFGKCISVNCPELKVRVPATVFLTEMQQLPAHSWKHISELTQAGAAHHANSAVAATGAEQLRNAQKQGVWHAQGL